MSNNYNPNEWSIHAVDAKDVQAKFEEFIKRHLPTVPLTFNQDGEYAHPEVNGMFTVYRYGFGDGVEFTIETVNKVVGKQVLGMKGRQK